MIITNNNTAKSYSFAYMVCIFMQLAEDAACDVSNTSPTSADQNITKDAQHGNRVQ